MYSKQSNFWLFVIGALSMTKVHVIGRLGLSELGIFLIAPIIFSQDVQKLRHDGFMPFIWLSLSTMVSCIISSVINGTEISMAIRGFASPYACFAIPVVLHRLLRNNLAGLKWMFVGLALSSLISIFALSGQSDPEAATYAQADAMEVALGDPLFYVAKICPWLELPVTSFYFSTPILVLIAIPIISAALALFGSSGGSGRSAALSVIGASILIAYCRKKQSRMMKFQRNFLVWAVIAIIGLTLFKTEYAVLAENGTLGEKAYIKYKGQTRRGTDMLSLLMGGRAEFFVCLFAAADKPIFGHGPWALDEKGYWLDFLAKYGVNDDYEKFALARQEGRTRPWIPAHTMLLGFWVWYGVIGFILWLYVLWLYFMHFKKYIYAIPQWFGYFVLAIPSAVWAIFFSPFGARVTILLNVTCVLIARAVAKGKIPIPDSMKYEIAREENI